MTSLLNMAQLNPMHVSSQDRLDMIALKMKDSDIVTLIGTRFCIEVERLGPHGRHGFWN